MFETWIAEDQQFWVMNPKASPATASATGSHWFGHSRQLDQCRSSPGTIDSPEAQAHSGPDRDDWHIPFILQISGHRNCSSQGYYPRAPRDPTVLSAICSPPFLLILDILWLALHTPLISLHEWKVEFFSDFCQQHWLTPRNGQCAVVPQWSCARVTGPAELSTAPISLLLSKYSNYKDVFGKKSLCRYLAPIQGLRLPNQATTRGKHSIWAHIAMSEPSHAAHVPSGEPSKGLFISPFGLSECQFSLLKRKMEASNYVWAI